ncbi:hypothetical protein SLE2022_007170 [Rubroshorea leprosula]
MDDPNPLENDPQRYCEEWFNIAILTGKEFQLPNLSPTLITNWLMESAPNTTPNFLLQIPPIQTNHPETDQNVASHNESQSLSLPSTVVALNDNIANYPSSSTDISSSIIPTSTQVSVHTTSTPQSNALVPVRSQFIPRFPFRNGFSFASSLITSLNLGNSWIGSFTSGNGCTILSTRRTDTPEIFSRNTRILGPGFNFLKADQEIQHPFEVSSYNFNPGPQNYGNNCFFGRLIEGSRNSSALPTVQRALEGAEKRKIDEHEFSLEKTEYKCFVCDLTFPNGNALGGHMSYHAKKRKLEAMKAGVFKAERSVRMENENDREEEFGDGSTVN